MYSDTQITNKGVIYSKKKPPLHHAGTGYRVTGYRLPV